MYHGQASESVSKWDMHTNPRPPGSRSLENVRFVVDDRVAAHLAESDQSPLKLEAMKVLAHVLSPSRTGVFDELLALIRSGVLDVNSRGIPVLANVWWTKVDMLILDDMSDHCGVRADPTAKGGVGGKIRNTLHRKWTKSHYGWVFADDYQEVVFDFEEYAEWRAAFEDKQRARSEGVDGVGRFK